MKKILFMLPILMVALVSCDKDNSNDNSIENDRLIKTISGYDEDEEGDYNITIEYDEQNRVTKATWSGYYEFEYIYEYNENEIIERYADSESYGIECRYILNDGYLIKKEDYRYGEDDPIIITYTYDSGLLRKTIRNEHGYSREAEYEWENGDIVLTRYPTNEVKYTYGEETKGNFKGGGYYSEEGFNDEIDYMNDGFLPFKGINSRHLIKSKTVYDVNSDIHEIRKYYYQFDSNGYVVEQSVLGDFNDSYNISCKFAYY